MSRLETLIARDAARSTMAVFGNAQPSQTKPYEAKLSQTKPSEAKPTHPDFTVYPMTDERRSERFIPQQSAVSLTLANGEKRNARITSVSRHSISVLADFTQIQMDQVTKVGKTHVKALRRFPGGAIFCFLAPLPDKIIPGDFSA